MAAPEKKKKPQVWVYASSCAHVELEIDVVAELKHMPEDKVKTLLKACQDALLSVPAAVDDGAPVGIDQDRGRRELAAIVDKCWLTLTPHAQFVARQLGV